MRLWIDTLIALLVTAVLGIVLTSGSDRADQAVRVVATADAAAQMQATARYQAIMSEAEEALAGLEPRRLPKLARHIDPAWFGDDRPINRLLADADRPWVDVAPAGDTAEHPPDPVLIHDDQAQFWFNPTTGVVRARVPMRATDAQTLELYEQANRVDLHALPAGLGPDRQPVAMVLPGDLEVTRASPTRPELVADALPGE
ncbi:MAG: hypothetical protein AAGI54_06860 [Planctomycetota bacterium]